MDHETRTERVSRCIFGESIVALLELQPVAVSDCGHGALCVACAGDCWIAASAPPPRLRSAIDAWLRVRWVDQCGPIDSSQLIDRHSSHLGVSILAHRRVSSRRASACAVVALRPATSPLLSLVTAVVRW